MIIPLLRCIIIRCNKKASIIVPKKYYVCDRLGIGNPIEMDLGCMYMNTTNCAL